MLRSRIRSRARYGQYPTGWSFPGAALDIDFVNNRAYVNGAYVDPANACSVTRASTKYVPSAAGVYTPFSSNILPRTDLGVLPEESRTNSIRNNSMQGAVAGTPGTLPTNWANNSSGVLTGMTYTVSLATVLGVEVLRLRVSGTPGATTPFRIAFDTTTAITVVAAEVWTESMFLALSSGSFTNVGTIKLSQQERTAAGAAIFNNQGSDIKASITSTLTRFSHAATMSGTTERNQPELNIELTSGQAVDFTLDIGWPQLELGAFATSPIRTTSAAATRAADAITLADFTPLSGMTEWSIYAEVALLSVAATGNGKVIAELSAGNYSNVTILRFDSTPRVEARASVGGVTQSSIIPAVTFAADVVRRTAARFKTNDFQAAVSGTLGTQDTSGSLPTLTMLAIGCGAQNSVGGIGSFIPGDQLNGYLRRLAVSRVGWIDAQLQAITQ